MPMHPNWPAVRICAGCVCSKYALTETCVYRLAGTPNTFSLVSFCFCTLAPLSVCSLCVRQATEDAEKWLFRLEETAEFEKWTKDIGRIKMCVACSAGLREC